MGYNTTQFIFRDGEKWLQQCNKQTKSINMKLSGYAIRKYRNEKSALHRALPV